MLSRSRWQSLGPLVQPTNTQGPDPARKRKKTTPARAPGSPHPPTLQPPRETREQPNPPKEARDLHYSEAKGKPFRSRPPWVQARGACFPRDPCPRMGLLLQVCPGDPSSIRWLGGVQ